MFSFIKNIYLTCYTLFFRFARNRWSYHFNVGKGVAGVAALEFLILMLIAVWIEINAGERFLLTVGKLPIGVAYFLLFIVNFYALVIRRHGTKFEREFSNLKAPRKNILLIVSWLLLLIVAGFFYYSIFAYYHFFHIVPKSW